MLTRMGPNGNRSGLSGFQEPAAGSVEEPALRQSGVDLDGFMDFIPDYVLEAVRRPGHGVGPPGPDPLEDYAQSNNPRG